MTVKIAHISDVHIRNLKYHDVYREVFKNLYKELDNEKVDYIVLTGDIAHTKTQISPEYVSMASEFFDKLSDIAKTVIIPGNHDGNLKNPNRLDAITPIVRSLNKDTIYFSRDSDVITFEDVDFYHLSVFDTENWPTVVDKNKINVALFHGAVSGIKTDMGHEITHGDAELSDFEEFDYGMFGDIHKTNQKVTEDGKIRYPGSLICQNFGETNDKGYLLWTLTDKENFDVVHRPLKNPKPFINVKLTPTGRLPQGVHIPDGSRVRLIASESISLDRMKKVVDIVKSSYRIESVSFLNRSGRDKKTASDSNKTLFNKNIRDVAVQQELIKEYLSEYKLTDDILSKVSDLNRTINSEVESQEQTARNVEWSLKSIEWDNLFNYGEGNKINFDKLEGIVGVFGKSYSGKSSIIDAILYTMFNSTSKSITKNYDLINQHKQNASGRVIVEIDNKDYVIERTSEKYKKKLKGVETEEAKTNVDFSVFDKVTKTTESLNGTTRSETDNKIRNQFGTLDDFMVTSLAAQFGSLAFIDQKSTDRKKILGKFLDLDFFEEKFKAAKNHSSDLRGALKIMETKDLDQEFKDNAIKLSNIKDNIDKQKLQIEVAESDVLLLQKQFTIAKENYDSIPKELGEPVKEKIVINSKQSVEKLENDLNKANEDLLQLDKNIEEINNLYVKLQNEQDWQTKLDEINSLDKKIDLLSKELTSQQEILNKIVEAEKNIENAPCNNEYSNCMMVEKAWKTLNEIGNSQVFKKNIDDLNGELKNHEEQKDALEPKKIREAIEKLESLERTRRESNEKKTALMSFIITKTNQLSEGREKLASLQEAYEDYCKNKEAFEAKEKYEKDYKEVQQNLRKTEQALEQHKEELNSLYSKQGYYDQKLENILEEKEKLNNLREEYAAYDLYKKCMHPNGIPFDIIKRKLPEINDEISKILSTIVKFEVFFEAQDNKLEVYIKHSKHDPRPIETGSGAEKTLAATAIRLALLNVSSLPKGDVFILDEPATELDEDTKEGFVRILDMIKVHFKNVILISHLESLKDVVDTQISIEKKNGYAFIEVE